MKILFCLVSTLLTTSLIAATCSSGSPDSMAVSFSLGSKKAELDFPRHCADGRGRVKVTRDTDDFMLLEFTFPGCRGSGNHRLLFWKNEKAGKGDFMYRWRENGSRGNGTRYLNCAGGIP